MSRRCTGDGCLVQHFSQRYSCFWKIHGTVKILLLGLQVLLLIYILIACISMFVFFSNFLPESSLKYELLGLNLLWLLTQNRVAEFHTELELLSPKDIQNNVFIHYPVSLEQYLMEGCYNKVINPCLKCVLIEKRRLIFVLC